MSRKGLAGSNGFIESFLTQHEAGSTIDTTVLTARGLSVVTGSYEDVCHHGRSRYLILKFPGTAGRAERSSRFPVKLSTLDRDSTDASHRVQEWPLIEAPCEMWAWNPPGYGRSPGRMTLDSLQDRAQLFARKVVDDRSSPDTHVVLCGNSLGCLAAMALATMFPNASLILKNPPDLVPVILRVADIYRGRWLMKHVCQHFPQQLQARSLAENCHQPAVFLMSERDRLVPPEMQRQIHDAYAGPKYVVTLEGLDHDSFLESRHVPQVQEAIRWWEDQTSV